MSDTRAVGGVAHAHNKVSSVACGAREYQVVEDREERLLQVNHPMDPEDAQPKSPNNEREGPPADTQGEATDLMRRLLAVLEHQSAAHQAGPSSNQGEQQ